jgi:hypothetical protein
MSTTPDLPFFFALFLNKSRGTVSGGWWLHGGGGNGGMGKWEDGEMGGGENGHWSLVIGHWESLEER